MRIDSHHHMWDLGVRDQPWTAGLPRLRRNFSFDDLRPALVAYGIDRTVLVETVNDLSETRELLAAAADEPRIAGVVGWVDLTAQNITAQLDEVRALPGGDKLVGLRHQVQQEPDPAWLLRPEVLNGLHAVAASALTFDLVIRAHQLPATVELAHTVPELQLVLDHAGKPRIAERQWQPWADDLAALAAAPNVSAKLSGLITEADHNAWTVADLKPYAEHVLDTFGASRVMFGSDWPVCLLAGSYAEVVHSTEGLISGLSESEQRAVFGGSAASVYGLDAA